MAKNRFLYILFVVACVIFSAAYQSRLSAVLLILALVYPLLAAIATLVSLFTLRISFGEKRAVYDKNESFELPLIIHNNFIFPYTTAEIDCMLPDNETGLFLRKQVYVSVAPLKKLRIFVPCMHRYRGSYEACAISLSVCDPLKIIRFTRKVGCKAQLVFLPRKLLLDELSGVFGGEGGVVPEQRPFGEKDDFSHVRDYLPGDVLQLIHWKLTAKLDTLMIKQYDTDNDRRSIVLCNFNRGSSTASAVLRQYDAVIESAIAVVLSSMKEGVKVFADIGLVGGAKYDIADNMGFDRFYDSMAELPLDITVNDFSEIIKSYSVVDAAVIFLITPVLDDNIVAAAEAVGEVSDSSVILLYINVLGKNTTAPLHEHYIYAELKGETDAAFSTASEQILTGYLNQK